MKKREDRSTLPDQKYKLLFGHWLSLGKSSKPAPNESGADGETLIERDSVVELLLKKKKKSDPDEFEDYLVMGIYNRHYNKFYLVNQDLVKPTWKPKMKSSQWQLAVRMIKWGASLSMYRYAKIGKNEEGTTEKAYRIVGLLEVVQVKGNKSNLGLKKEE